MSEYCCSLPAREHALLTLTLKQLIALRESAVLFERLRTQNISEGLIHWQK